MAQLQKTTRNVWLSQDFFVPLYLCRRAQLTLFIHHQKHTKVMNKKWKTILQVISYIITLLLGGAAGNVVM